MSNLYERTFAVKKPENIEDFIRPRKELLEKFLDQNTDIDFKILTALKKLISLHNIFFD